MMKRTKEQLEDQVREDGTLAERLKKCRSMIGKMCKERRPPKMTIPLQWYDEDFYICRTIEDAIEKLSPKPQEKPPGCEYPYCNCGHTCPGLFPAEQESQQGEVVYEPMKGTLDIINATGQQGEVNCRSCDGEGKRSIPGMMFGTWEQIDCLQCNGTGWEES